LGSKRPSTIQKVQGNPYLQFLCTEIIEIWKFLELIQALSWADFPIPNKRLKQILFNDERMESMIFMYSMDFLCCSLYDLCSIRNQAKNDLRIKGIHINAQRKRKKRSICIQWMRDVDKNVFIKPINYSATIFLPKIEPDLFLYMWLLISMLHL